MARTSGDDSERTRRPRWALAAWILVLVGAVWLFTRVGHGALETPPLAAPATLGPWLAGRAPTEILFASLRLLVLVLAWYLLGVTTIGLLARALRRTRLVATADLVTLPAVRRILQAAFGIGLATAAVTSLPVASMPAPSAVVVSDGRVTTAAETALGATTAPDGAGPGAHDPGSSAMPGSLPADTPAAITDHALSSRAGFQGDRATEPVAVAPTPPVAEGAEPAASSPAPSSTSETPASQWRVASGEHLWAIAEAALSAAWDRSPADDEIAGYWVELVERNRPNLPDPANPDLIHPGLELELPEPPPEPAP